jgi:hypothetical protein
VNGLKSIDNGVWGARAASIGRDFGEISPSPTLVESVLPQKGNNKLVPTGNFVFHSLNQPRLLVPEPRRIANHGFHERLVVLHVVIEGD